MASRLAPGQRQHAGGGGWVLRWGCRAGAGKVVPQTGRALRALLLLAERRSSRGNVGGRDTLWVKIHTLAEENGQTWLNNQTLAQGLRGGERCGGSLQRCPGSLHASGWALAEGLGCRAFCPGLSSPQPGSAAAGPPSLPGSPRPWLRAARRRVSSPGVVSPAGAGARDAGEGCREQREYLITSPPL